MDKFEKDILGKIFDDDADDVKACPIPGAALPKGMALAMAYVPFQMWETPYEDDVAFSRGTVFPCLDKPFIGEEAVKNARTE